MKTILVVDDNEPNRYLLSALLQGAGYAVKLARHGEEALAIARDAAPDLVISDLLMPVMDGYTLLRLWRADEELQRIPFLVYTATYIAPKDERLALDLGADAFVVKPEEPDALMRRIQELLAPHTSGTPAAESRPGTGDDVLLKDYNAVLFGKLEAKMAQLERTNQALRDEIAMRKETEERLRIHTAAVEQSTVAMVIATSAGSVEYVNPLFTEMTGWSLEEARTRDPWEVLSVAKGADRRDQIAKAIEARGYWQEEVRAPREDGEVHWLRATVSPIRDDAGTTTHLLAVQEDITAQRVLEAQYLQSQKIEAVDRLAGGIAHDFNNMLSVILGYTEALMLDLKPSDPLYRDIEQIRSAADRSADLTRQLLAFSRQQTIAPVSMDLNAQVREMKGLLQPLIGEDVDMRFDLAADLWAVHLDPSQADQILANLAVNARDVMPDGGRLTIETANVHLDEPSPRSEDRLDPDFRPGDYVRLTVSDSGCGMDAETIEHIFEPFFTTKAPGAGTGLGLATVYGIVKQNKGLIDVHSELGQGTTFRVHLPRHHGDATPSREVRHLSEAHHGDETILLVEDDPMVRTLTRRILKRSGYAVLDAAGPKEAIALCERHPGDIHLLLTDVVMPDMNGKDLHDRIRAARPTVKTLFMSGYSADAIANRGVLDQRTHFIGKPFNAEELCRKVRETLDAED